MEKSFLEFVKNGGGVVVYHAANNAFKDWEEYNRIIGFGGWGGREETAGPYIYRQDGYLKYGDKSSGCAGSHGCRHEFVLHFGSTTEGFHETGIVQPWFFGRCSVCTTVRRKETER